MAKGKKMRGKPKQKKLTAKQKRLTKAELVKDAELKTAEAILKKLDNVEIQWVKGDGRPGKRRVIQVVG